VYLRPRKLTRRKPPPARGVPNPPPPPATRRSQTDQGELLRRLAGGPGTTACPEAPRPAARGFPSLRRPCPGDLRDPRACADLPPRTGRNEMEPNGTKRNRSAPSGTNGNRPERTGTAANSLEMYNAFYHIRLRESLPAAAARAGFAHSPVYPFFPIARAHTPIGPCTALPARPCPVAGPAPDGGRRRPGTAKPGWPGPAASIRNTISDPSSHHHPMFYCYLTRHVKSTKRRRQEAASPSRPPLASSANAARPLFVAPCSRFRVPLSWFPTSLFPVACHLFPVTRLLARAAGLPGRRARALGVGDSGRWGYTRGA